MCIYITYASTCLLHAHRHAHVHLEVPPPGPVNEPHFLPLASDFGARNMQSFVCFWMAFLLIRTGNEGH